MAGYLISLDSASSLAICVGSGVYSTKLSQPTNGKWAAHHEGTFADYCSMKPGDNIYFFIDRRIYGIGKLVNIGGDCKYLNFPNAGEPRLFSYDEVKDSLLFDFGSDSGSQRFVCLFEPDPAFFKKGIDMDDVLSSEPDRFKMLRVFWKRSFIKFSDEENQAFRNILLQRNSIGGGLEDTETYDSNHSEVHRLVASRLNIPNYSLEIAPFLNPVSNPNGSLRHEMALEAGLVFQITNKDENALTIFGEWDYISHQVHSSPFKPVDYMDKMDVFGYRYIPGHAPTIANFLVIELKAGTVLKQDLLQLMKYVDWIKNEYASGDYSMIKAFLVGYDFDQDCFDGLNDSVERNFIHGFRPSTPMRWNDVTLVSYRHNSSTSKLNFRKEAHASDPIR